MSSILHARTDGIYHRINEYRIKSVSTQGRAAQYRRLSMDMVSISLGA